jgi:hypothetical protein
MAWRSTSPMSERWPLIRFPSRKRRVQPPTGVGISTYERRCDECRRFYEHIRGSATGWCPECAAGMLAVARLPAPSPGYHLPYVQPLEHGSGSL